MICYLKSGEYDCEDVLVLRFGGRNYGTLSTR